MTPPTRWAADTRRNTQLALNQAAASGSRPRRARQPGAGFASAQFHRAADRRPDGAAAGAKPDQRADGEVPERRQLPEPAALDSTERARHDALRAGDAERLDHPDADIRKPVGDGAWRPGGLWRLGQHVHAGCRPLPPTGGSRPTSPRSARIRQVSPFTPIATRATPRRTRRWSARWPRTSPRNSGPARWRRSPARAARWRFTRRSWARWLCPEGRRWGRLFRRCRWAGRGCRAPTWLRLQAQGRRWAQWPRRSQPTQWAGRGCLGRIWRLSPAGGMGPLAGPKPMRARRMRMPQLRGALSG